MFTIPDFFLNRNNEDIYRRWFKDEETEARFDRARKAAGINKSEDRHARMVKNFWRQKPVKLKRKGTRKANWIPKVLKTYFDIYYMRDTAFKGNIYLNKVGDSIAQRFHTLDEAFLYLAEIDIEVAKESFRTTGRNIFGFVEIEGIDEKGRLIWKLNELGQQIFILQWDEDGLITLWRFNNSDRNPQKR